MCCPRDSFEVPAPVENTTLFGEANRYEPVDVDVSVNVMPLLGASSEPSITGVGLEYLSWSWNRRTGVVVLAMMRRGRGDLIVRSRRFLRRNIRACGCHQQAEDQGSVSHHHQGIRVTVLCPQAVETNIIANSPDGLNRSSGGSGVASGDGVLSPGDVAQACVEAIRAEKFHVLPHPEVATYMERKATDVDRWLAGMRRFQSVIYADRPLPGDAMAPSGI